MSVTAEELITINIICASEAVSLCGLSACSCSIAFNPAGVAALSSPSTLAAMFITIEPTAGESAGTPGMIRANSGRSSRARASVMPDRSAIFNKPSHRQSNPVRFSAIEKADLAEAKRAAVNSFQTAQLSSKLCQRAPAKAERKKNDQIILSMAYPRQLR